MKSRIITAILITIVIGGVIMAYTKTTWTDEVPASTPVKYSATDDVDGVIFSSAVITTVTGITPGTPFNAANLNHLEDGVYDADAAATAAQATADAAIPKSLATEAGQIPLSSAAGVFTTIDAIGSDGLMLKSDGSTWTTGYPKFLGVRAENISGITLLNSNYTPIPFTTENYDTDGFHSNVSDTTKFYIPITGYYSFQGAALFNTNSTGTRDLRIRINGSSYPEFSQVYAFGAGATPVKINFIYPYNAGTYIELYAWQNSGGDLDVMSLYFTISLLGTHT